MISHRLAILVVMLVVFICALALMGHGFDVRELASWGENWVTMKFASAVAILACCYAMLVNERPRATFDGWVIAATVIVMGCVSHLPDWGETDEIYTVAKSMPSLASLAGILLFSSAYWFRKKTVRLTCDALVLFIALSAFTGYLTSSPGCYFYIPGVSTALALPTAVSLFSLVLARHLDSKSK